MLIGRTLPKQILVILSVWLLMTGMAVLDGVDLTDELAHPWVTWDQAIDPELEEPDDESGSPAQAVGSPLQPGPSVLSGSSLRAAPRIPSAQRESRLLFQDIAQYRI